MNTHMGPIGNDRDDHRNNIGVIERDPETKKKPKLQKPSMYKVLLFNDDYTPMEFVVYLLQKYFNKNTEEATTIMLHVHKRGVGVAGIYTHEVAETKAMEVMNDSRANGHPLKAGIEKDE